MKKGKFLYILIFSYLTIFLSGVNVAHAQKKIILENIKSNDRSLGINAYKIDIADMYVILEKDTLFLDKISKDIFILDEDLLNKCTDSLIELIIVTENKIFSATIERSNFLYDNTFKFFFHKVSGYKNLIIFFRDSGVSGVYVFHFKRRFIPPASRFPVEPSLSK